METLIKCENLRFTYQDTEVLHGINFEVNRGEIVGLLGKNGAGKSTSINILMGFLEPDSGKCEVFGQPSHKLSPAERVRIGLLHEGFTQYNFMTIGEIEKFYSAFYPNWDRDVYYKLIDKLKVPYSRKVTRLSCGQRSQVTLGLILAQQAELLILDDYSLGLDVGYRRLFLDFLREYITKSNATVLLTSHIVAELDDMLDRVIIVQRGDIIADKTRDDLLTSFNRYDIPLSDASMKLVSGDGPLYHVDQTTRFVSVYTYAKEDEIKSYLSGRSTDLWKDAQHYNMSIEDAFVGLTGRY